MAAVYSTQYQPISNAETCTNAALTVRAARDFIDSLNNAKRYAMLDKVLSHISPLGTASASGSTDEVVVLMFAPRYVPHGFRSVWFEAGCKPVNGSGTTTWRLYTMPSKYRGPAILDADVLPSGYEVATVITDTAVSNAHARPMNSVALSRATDGTTWTMLTAQNNVASSYSRVYTVDAWPIMP